MSTSDPNAAFATALDALRGEKYDALDQDAAAHTVHVYSHLDENAPVRTVIAIHVDGGAVHFSAAGPLVRADGTISRNLNSELGALHRLLKKRLGSGPAAPVGVVGVSPPQPMAPAAPGSLPVAWSEPAYDPSVWGHGNFTCLPIKLPAEEQAQLVLKLSNGESADVLLSLAYAPELCRSPGECKLPGGCPALGIGDPERVSRLAGRLSKSEVSTLATLLFKGQPVATIDLAKHGSIAQAMTEIKH